MTHSIIETERWKTIIAPLQRATYFEIYRKNFDFMSDKLWVTYDSLFRDDVSRNKTKKRKSWIAIGIQDSWWEWFSIYECKIWLWWDLCQQIREKVNDSSMNTLWLIHMNHQEFEFLEHSFRPALDSGLSVGDQLLQVDGQSLISVTHLNAIRFLKGIPFTQKP